MARSGRREWVPVADRLASPTEEDSRAAGDATENIGRSGSGEPDSACVTRKGVGYLAALLSAPGRKILAWSWCRARPSTSHERRRASRDRRRRAARRRRGREDDPRPAGHRRLPSPDRGIAGAGRRGGRIRRSGARQHELATNWTSSWPSLRRATGLGGRSRPRRLRAERARQSVTKAIQGVLRRVRRARPRARCASRSISQDGRLLRLRVPIQGLRRLLASHERTDPGLSPTAGFVKRPLSPIPSLADDRRGVGPDGRLDRVFL